MINDSEFVMIREFDKTIARHADQAQSIINGKNATIGSLTRRVAAMDQVIADLRAALAAEQAKSASLMRQIRGVMAARH